MRLPGRRSFVTVAVICASHGLCFCLSAQSSANPQISTRSNRIHAAASVPLPPELPPVKSPVDLFRELLAMTPAERNHFLAGRSPENRKLILAKVREYLSLKPDVRELRLRVTELRWYLWPLMNTDPTNRTAQLARIPEADRRLVENRLREWDILPPILQQQLLKNEATIRYFTELQDQNGKSPGISPARREKLEAGIREWQALPDNDRQNLIGSFNRFFGLNESEKTQALRTLSEPERRQIEKTLHNFGQLSQQERAQCIRSFEKFASLSLQERQQFLKNAERWNLMTPAERQAWRDLVNSAPPLPPNLAVPPRLPPPAPRHALPSVATTNGGG